MSANQLLKRYPARFVTRGKLWTPSRSSIEWSSSHEPLVGKLLTVLVSRTEPIADDERELLERLHEHYFGRRSDAPTDGKADVG